MARAQKTATQTAQNESVQQTAAADPFVDAFNDPAKREMVIKLYQIAADPEKTEEFEALRQKILAS